MTGQPTFPPLLKPFAVTPDIDPFERALKLAEEGADPGTLLWSIGQDTCQCAVVLAPEQPLEPSLPIVLIAMLGLAEGLGSLIPPLVAVTFGWPDRIEVNGGVAGGVRFACAPTESADEIPEWLVIGISVAVRGPWSERDRHGRQRTTLEEEGCGDLLTSDLIEAFARHLLGWINRWQEDGVEPVRQAWLSRATGLGKPVELRLGDQVRAGTFEGISETGTIRLVRNGVAQTIALDEAMREPTWSN